MKKIIYTFAILISTHLLHAQSWSELGWLNGLAANSYVFSVCSDASGNIYGGGWFTNSSGYRYVAKYDGSAWSELGGLNGLAANELISCVCSDASGNIYAAGNFTNSSGNWYVAKYDGSSWSELGGLNGLGANGYVYSVCSDASGNIYAAGWFTNSSGNWYVAKYDGSTWSELGGLNGLAANWWFECICSDASGNIYAAGGFTNSSGHMYVAKYDGSAWSELGGLDGLAANWTIRRICSDASGNIYAEGQFTNSSGNYYVAKYDGSTWSELGGLNGLAADHDIVSVCSDASGNIYAAGQFLNSSGIRYVAKYDGSAWSELGGLNGLSANDCIFSVCSDASGNIYTAGWFTNSSGYRYIARYGLPFGPAFSSSDSTVCEKFCIDFHDQSLGNPVSWQWNFEGGTPASSTDQNPTNICYNDSGVFDVSLITIDGNGNSDTLLLSDFITVYGNPFAPVITQLGNVLICSAASSYQWYLNEVIIPGATNQVYSITESGLYTVVIENENGCEAQTDFDAVWIGIEDLNSNFSFNIFPNPASDQITISLSTLEFRFQTFKIVNLLGQEVLSSEIKMEGEKTLTININSLPAGIYKVVVIGEGISEASFVKQ